jgi:uncharacterized protein
MACYRAVPDGVVVAVRLTPKAAQDALDGVGSLPDGSQAAMARVRALPAKGAANSALVELLAKALKIPRRSIAIVGGAGGRLKRVRIAGDGDLLAAKIEQWPKLS